MITLISPAKNLDFETQIETIVSSQPLFIKEASQLIKKIKKLSPADLEQLMKISPKLADLNYERNQNWQYPFPKGQSKQAGLAFNGEVYNGLNLSSFSQAEQDYAQNNLRILSGLYGLLKPFDQILPYRLEMGTKFAYTEDQKNLYKFWGNKITNELNQLSTNSSYLVNLASTEYFKSVNTKILKPEIITPVFKDFKNGQYKVIMMYAKNARGLMASYIQKNKITSLDGIKAFEGGGYIFNETLSQANELTFTRG
ncbi:peroxide stress protein YaaA [Cyclobacteriaceae bacterium]|nr:peroxide stress protein YaaA [Cyclobacteriaceae bacterium]